MEQAEVATGAVQLGIDGPDPSSLGCRRALIRTKRRVSARRQMAEALRWLKNEERGASPALLLRLDAHGPLPIAAQGICLVARELGARGKKSRRLRIDELEAMNGGLRLRFVASSACLRTAAPSPLAPKGRSVPACSALTCV